MTVGRPNGSKIKEGVNNDPRSLYHSKIILYIPNERTDNMCKWRYQ